MKQIIFLSTILLTSLLTFGQNQDANPYGGIYYNDQSNVRNYGRFVLPRSETSNLDTLTNLVKGMLVFDTLENRIEYADTSGAWIGISAGNTLDQAYDQGGKGFGREIVADSGAVWISGEDGFIVTGTVFEGDTIQFASDGGDEYPVMYFNPRLGAFRAGTVEEFWWNEGYVGEKSFATGNNTNASGVSSTAMGDATTASGEGSTATGKSTTASGTASASFGFESTAKSYGETSIGTFNTDYTPTATDAWFWSDRLFVVGNGVNSGSRSNALTILKNGNSGFGTDTPDTTVHIVGQIKYEDGNEADGYVLTSDANGNATWQSTTQTQRSAATNGGTTNASEGTETLLLEPASLIAIHTVNFPPNPIDGQTFTIISNGNEITNLTLAATGNTIVGSLTTITNVGRSFKYIAANNLWAAY